MMYTADERAAHAKGYGLRFYNYVDIDEPIWIRAEDYAKLVAWCEPYMARGFEVQGAIAINCRHVAFDGIVVERVYVMGGNSESFRTTCKMDADDMLCQMQVDYPRRTQFKSDEVGWWHLHPGYYPSLSVGDVEECRQTLRDVQAIADTRVVHLLMYGDPRGGYQLSGYLIGLEEVNRLPVRILEGESN